MLPLVLAVAGAVVRVAVDAPATCTDHDAFARAVMRHSAEIAVGDEGAGSIELRVREGEDVEGTVRVAAPGRASWERTIRGRSCEEVTDALALVVAMSFDETPRPAPPPPPAPIRTPEPESPDRIERSTPSPSSWRGAVGASAGPLLLGAASLSLSYGGFAELELDRAGFAPSLRLGVTHAESSVDVNGRGAALVWTTAHVGACPLRGDLSAAVQLRACAGLELGVLSASPRGLSSANDATRVWASAAATGRVRFVPGQLLFVEGDLGLTIPIVRDELAADPSLTLYRAPVVAPLVALSAGIRFP